MTVVHDWADPAGPLRKLSQVLKFPLEDLCFAEKPETVSYSAEFPTSALAFPANDPAKGQKLSELNSALKNLHDRYGDSATLKLRSGGLEIFSIQEYQTTNLHKIYDQILKSRSIGIDLIINKPKLLTKWALIDSALIKIFIFPKALERSLTVSLNEIEKSDKSVLKSLLAQQKLLILVPDHPAHNAEFELYGDWLTVLGGSSVDKWQSYLPKGTNKEALSKVQSMHDKALNQLKWTNLSLQCLTPQHLFVNWTAKNGKGQPTEKNDLIARALFAQLLTLSVLYSARESRFSADNSNDTSWLAIYKADKYLAEVEIPNRQAVSAMIGSDAVKNPGQLGQVMAQIIDWIYNDELGISNRIELLQIAIAGFLEDRKPSEALVDLVVKAPEIWQRVQRRWEAFISEKLDKYFAQIQQLEERVESTTKTYNEQIESLTKGLTDNMLAAVAVIVGSFIAAIFNSPFRAYIFIFGSGIYAIYLLVFPMIIGLISAWQRFTNAQSSFLKHQQEFENRLSKEEVAKIVGTRVSDNERRFENWYNRTWAIYVIVLCLMVVSILAVPGLLKSWNNKFSLSGVTYETPIDREVVPLSIRGDGFDNNKEIVVAIGGAKLSNTDGKSVKVHGSTVLTLTPRREDLVAATQKDLARIAVRQGDSNEQTIAVPTNIPAAPEPDFGAWKWTNANRLEISGSGFGLISQILIDGLKVPFEVSLNGKSLEFTDQKTLQKLRSGGVPEIVMQDGTKRSLSPPARPPKTL